MSHGVNKNLDTTGDANESAGNFDDASDDNSNLGPTRSTSSAFNAANSTNSSSRNPELNAIYHIKIPLPVLDHDDVKRG